MTPGPEWAFVFSRIEEIVMSIIIAGRGDIPGAAALAASKSAVFNSAPDPQRFGLHSQGRGDPQRDAEISLAAKLIRSGLDQDQVTARLQETYPGMHKYTAQSRYDAGFQRLEKQLGGRASDGTPPIRIDAPFAGPQDARAFAFRQLAELKSSISSYNAAILNWSTEKAEAFRAQTWASGYEAYKRNHEGATEAEAIAFADKGLRFTLAREGKVYDGNIRSALGPLEHAFRLSPWSLIRENEDGTLSLNPTTLSFGGETILEIGSPIGQNVDQVA